MGGERVAAPALIVVFDAHVLVELLVFAVVCIGGDGDGGGGGGGGG